MAYDLTNLLMTIAGCSSTIIAIVGGFIASKLISINTEYRENLMKLNEVQEELSFKKSRIDELNNLLNKDDALRLIYENLEAFVFGTDFKDVYEKEKDVGLDFQSLELLWNESFENWEKLKKVLHELQTEEIDMNTDGIPKCFKEELDEFNYDICKKALSFYDNYLIRNQKEGISNWRQLVYRPPIAFKERWYYSSSNEIDDLNNSIKWLIFQEDQFNKKITAIVNPKGMKHGLFVFVLFSICSIIVPLTLIPFSTNDIQLYTRVRYGVIIGFIFGLSSVFIYFAALLNSKE